MYLKIFKFSLFLVIILLSCQTSQLSCDQATIGRLLGVHDRARRNSNSDNYAGGGRVNARGEVYYPAENRKCPSCPNCPTCSVPTTASPVVTAPSNTSVFDPTDYTMCQFFSYPFVCSPQECKSTLQAAATQVPSNPYYGQFYVDPIRVSRCQLKEGFTLAIVRGCFTPDVGSSSVCYSQLQEFEYTCAVSYFITCEGHSFYSTCLSVDTQYIYVDPEGCDKPVIDSPVELKCTLRLGINSILIASTDFTFTILPDNVNC